MFAGSVATSCEIRASTVPGRQGRRKKPRTNHIHHARATTETREASGLKHAAATTPVTAPARIVREAVGDAPWGQHRVQDLVQMPCGLALRERWPRLGAITLDQQWRLKLHQRLRRRYGILGCHPAAFRQLRAVARMWRTLRVWVGRGHTPEYTTGARSNRSSERCTTRSHTHRNTRTVGDRLGAQALER